MRGKVATLFGFGVAGLCCLAVIAAPQASATTGVNQKISFVGKLVTAAGINIPNGTYNMEFKIYTAAGSCNPTTGVGCTLGWTEDWLVNASNGVVFTSGTYHVDLDSVAANNFSGIDFNTYPLYLSLQIGNTSSCTPAGNFTANCGGDGEMKPYILLTSTPYSLNSNLLDGLDSTAFGQLAANQTWTGTNTFQPTTNINGLTVKQTSVGSPTADIFDVQSANNSNIIQITGPSANNAAVSINSLGANAITLTSGAALTFTGAANSTWDLGAAHTLSIQTTNNGAITTGTGLLTVGGDQTFSGTTARTITGPSTGGLTLTVASGPLSLTTTSSGALTITAAAASTWSTSAGALVIQSASGSAFTASSQGAGQSNFGTVGTGITVFGNSTGNTQLQGPLYGSSDGGVLVGDGSVTATPLLLVLNNSSLQGAETAGNCSTTINSGAIYYSASTASSNTTTNEVRGCINGEWTDVVTADQLGILLLGVEASSGATAGDIAGITGFTNSPCKVTWSTTTSVDVAPCVAYSGGRKVVLTASVNISGLGTAGSVRFQHICLSGTNGAPQATASNTSETGAVPTWNASGPILCLATVKLSTTPAITNIYDTRVFVTSTKTYVTSSTAVAPGMVVIDDAAVRNGVKTTTTATTSPIRGVIAVGNSAGSTTTINAVLVTGGQAFVKNVSVPPTNGNTAKTSTTAGYVQSAAPVANSTYTDLGLITDIGSTAACNAATNCQFSVLVDVLPY